MGCVWAMAAPRAEDEKNAERELLQQFSAMALTAVPVCVESAAAGVAGPLPHEAQGTPGLSASLALNTAYQNFLTKHVYI